MPVKGRRAERAEQTREDLCREARRLFAARGYSGVSLGAIVGEAGVTKGALYHHFSDKQELFRAVVEQIQRELVDEIERAADDAEDPYARVELMCRAYLDAAVDPELRMLLLEAPVVLGWKAWCEIDHAYTIGSLTECLERAMEAGVIVEQAPATLAQVLLGALNNAARVIAAAPEPEGAREMVGSSIERLVGGLRR